MSHQKLWHAFPKKSFTALFGGNSQHGPRVAVSPPRARETGYSGFLFLKHFYQPFIPVEPGEPGVFVSASLRQPDWPTHEKVLVSAIAGERNPTGGYRYVGDYELLLEGGPLTVDEVRLLHPRVLDYWTRYVRDASSKHTWVEEMRMRILCRKYFPGQEPSEAIFRKAELEKLTLGDVSEAFKDGDEKLYAWGMRCVWYEPSFQERLIEGQIADDEQDGRESRGSTAEDGSSPIETRSGRERAARKRARTGESSEGIIEVDDDM
ncbi:hypothetical protein BV25DRAFT_1820810 [Artomyces pyxidatus]|uniref:Uncharacterized protein n=1 Tax=Artomyces pyxidatus TaxID=48021 RepID=A0ACB8TEB0_9AGAM|nr:hypothetical protein BV25DRAFT_1820810 [Artomyces pyxidatus]